MSEQDVLRAEEQRLDRFQSLVGAAFAHRTEPWRDSSESAKRYAGTLVERLGYLAEHYFGVLYYEALPQPQLMQLGQDLSVAYQQLANDFLDVVSNAHASDACAVSAALRAMVLLESIGPVFASDISYYAGLVDSHLLSTPDGEVASREEIETWLLELMPSQSVTAFRALLNSPLGENSGVSSTSQVSAERKEEFYRDQLAGRGCPAAKRCDLLGCLDI